MAFGVAGGSVEGNNHMDSSSGEDREEDNTGAGQSTLGGSPNRLHPRDKVFLSRGVGRDTPGNLGTSGLLGSYYGPASR